jgi:hypothetical protein
MNSYILHAESYTIKCPPGKRIKLISLYVSCTYDEWYLQGFTLVPSVAMKNVYFDIDEDVELGIASYDDFDSIYVEWEYV